LQEEFAPRQRDILAKQKEYEDLAAKFQKDAAVMGETERRNMENELRDLQREVTRLQNDFQEDLNLRQNEEMSNLQVSLLQEIQGYAAQEGYDLLVGDGVLYASGAVNITEQVLRAVEANFQASNTAP
jgi:outer membrane protein